MSAGIGIVAPVSGATALPLGVRNRLAELILEALDGGEARATIEALATFCRDPGGRLRPDESVRLAGLPWFERSREGGVRLRGAEQGCLPALTRRVERAVALLRASADDAEPGGLVGLLWRAARLARHDLYFEVHELLEPAWLRSEGPERVALQGLIQVAVAFHHAENGNRAGTLALLADGVEKLGTAGESLPVECGLWVTGLRDALRTMRAGEPLPPVPPWPGPTERRGDASGETTWRSS
jgi:hypothetical protein